MEVDDLVRAVQAGDKRASLELSRWLSIELRRYFRREFGDVEAQDLAQDAVIVVVRKLPEFEVDPARPFIHWVRGIARIQANQARRERGKQQNLGAAVRAEPQPRPATGPDTVLSRERRLKLVYGALEKLDSRYRGTIKNDLAEEDLDDFAERESIKRGSVRTRRRRGYESLRRLVHLKVVKPHKSTPSPPPES